MLLIDFMNALCNSCPENNYLIINNPNFCAFIEIENDIRILLMDQYLTLEKELIGNLHHTRLLSKSIVRPASANAIANNGIPGADESFSITTS